MSPSMSPSPKDGRQKDRLRGALELLALAALLAAVLFCGFFAQQEKQALEESSPTIGVLQSEGLRILSRNPVVAEEGKAVFTVEIEQGYVFSSCSDGVLENGTLTVSLNSEAGKTVCIELAKYVELDLAASDFGEMELISVATEEGDDPLPKGLYRTDREVTVQLTPFDHYQADSVKVGKEIYPVKSDGRVSFCPMDGVPVEAVFLGEPVSVRLNSGRLGSIRDLSGSNLFRYGEHLQLQAEYDAETHRFLGFSSGDFLKEGGTLLTQEDTYTGVLAGDAEIYANFEAKNKYVLRYADASLGLEREEFSPGEAVVLPLYDDRFAREGYTAIGFSSSGKGDDDSADFHSFGATILMPKEDLTLSVVYKPHTPLSYLSYTVSHSTVTVNGLSQTGRQADITELVIPETIEGLPVTVIATSAFSENKTLESLYLPLQLRQILGHAFENCQNLQKVTFPETLTTLRDTAFEGCDSLHRMQVLASLEKVYDIDYDSALADKYLRLTETDGAKRIILVGGSGLSFGIQSELLEKAYPGYTVINFSTSVYYGIRPLLSMLENHVQEGDILVFAPEFRSYMYGEETTTMTNWQYLESNYDMLRDLDLQENPILLKTYLSYLKGKRSYIQKGEKKYNSLVYSRASFNLYGDLSAVRSGQRQQMDSYLPSEDILTDEGMAFLAKKLSELREKGADCYMTFPAIAMPGDCNAADVEREETLFLARLREGISKELFPLISKLSDYCMPYSEIYDTMYHLSTEGAENRTKRLIQDLDAVLKS